MSDRLEDGQNTVIAFGSYPTALIYAKTVAPPGIIGEGLDGEKGWLETTSNENTAWRTFIPKKFKALSPCVLVAAYNPTVYSTIVSMAQINQLITITFPDGTVITFYGWLGHFVPQPIEKGEQPTAEIIIYPSNLNGSEVETGPTVT